GLAELSILNARFFTLPRAVIDQVLPDGLRSAWLYGLLARRLLLARRNEERMPHVATVPAGERPVIDDLGVHHHLDVHVEERNDLKAFKLIVADLAQLLVIRLGVSDLQQVFPHLVDRIVLIPVWRRLARVEGGDLRLHRFFGGDTRSD